jgi:hypothetical protein
MNYIETHYVDVLDLIKKFINIHGIYKYDHTNLVKIYKSSPFNYYHIIKEHVHISNQNIGLVKISSTS